MWFEKISPPQTPTPPVEALDGLDYALALLSVADGVTAVEVGDDQCVNIYVRSVDELYPYVAAVMRRHAPEVHGQVRGPSYPLGPRSGQAVGLTH